MKQTSILILICNVFLCVDSNSLHNHLESINYDKTERPYFHEGKPVNVTLQIFIYTIGPIDEADFTFHIGYYMRQWWTDPRLIFNETILTETASLDNHIWIPDTAMADTEQLTTFANGIRTVINHVTGAAFVSRRLKASTKCEMNLKHYPMDLQICQVIFENYAFTTKNIEIFWHTQSVFKRDGIVLDGYKLIDVTSKSEKIIYNVGNETQHFKQLIANVKVKRTYMYHVFRAYIPSILLLAFALGTFWVPDSAVPARMGMIVTSFLSNTFILQGVTENTVKVSYTTPMQYFLVVNVVMITMSLLEYLLILQLRRSSEATAISKEKRSTQLHHQNGQNPAFIIDNEQIKKTVAAKEKKSPIMKKNKKEHIHIVDRISQIVFPVFYFIFCVVYFSYYITEGNE